MEEKRLEDRFFVTKIAYMPLSSEDSDSFYSSQNPEDFVSVHDPAKPIEGLVERINSLRGVTVTFCGSHNGTHTLYVEGHEENIRVNLSDYEDIKGVGTKPGTYEVRKRVYGVECVLTHLDGRRTDFLGAMLRPPIQLYYNGQRPQSKRDPRLLRAS